MLLLAPQSINHSCFTVVVAAHWAGIGMGGGLRITGRALGGGAGRS